MNIIDFRGRLAIHPGEALYLIGYSRTLEGAKKTARNLIYRNAFPLPLTMVAGHYRVLVPDLFRGLGLDDSAVPEPAVQPAMSKRGPGRPRKMAQSPGGGHEQ
jgi:hypothetical protein